MNLPLILSVGLLLTASLAAQTSTLSGRVVDWNNVPILNASVITSNGGLPAATDVNGNFTITGLRNRVYTIQIDPRGDFLAPAEFDITVTGATNLGTRVIQPGVPITVQVVGPTGAPLLGANLSAFLPDGTKLFTPHDGSDVLGNAKVSVPITPINFRVLPPVGSTLVPIYEDMSPVVGTTIAMGTRSMRQGWSITGSVVRSGVSPLPVANAELIATSQLTGEVIFLANKRTNTLGAFNLLLPFGLYTIDIVPALGSPYAARQMFGVFVTDYPRNLGLVTCAPGVLLSGTVTSPTGAVSAADIDIDIYTANGHKLFTPNDNTSVAGVFSVVVPTGGTYSVRVDPPVARSLCGIRTNPVVVNAATNVGAINLVPGVAATVAVVDAFGTPIPGATAKVRDSATNFEFVVPGNTADAAGVIHAVVPIGTLDLTIQAPQGATSAPLVLNGIPVSAPFAGTVPLPQKTLRTHVTGLAGSGILSVSNGGDIYIDWAIANQTALLQSFTVEVVVELPSGVDVPFIPQIPLEMPGPLALTLPFWVPTPLLPANELGFLQKFMLRLRDAATLQLLDESYVYYVAL